MVFLKKLFIAIFVLCSFVFVVPAWAADIYFSPKAGEHQIGSTFNMAVQVSSKIESINAVSVSVNYPVDKLEVVSISKVGSMISLWVQEPAFNNSLGIVSCEGIVLADDYSGFTGNGTVINITFKVKAAGNASVTYQTASVLANDGKGTNILKGVGSASFVLGSREVEKDIPVENLEPVVPTKAVEDSEHVVGGASHEPDVVVTEVINTDVPDLPVITSITHPVQDKWYQVNRVEFSWDIPRNVIGINILANQSSRSDPGDRADGRFSRHVYEDVKDGVWYFHIKYQNNLGWGPVKHYKFQIDTQKPNLTVNILPQEKNKPQMFEIKAADKLSGIKTVEIYLNEKLVLQNKEGQFVYEAKDLKTGKYNLRVVALDEADNFVEKLEKVNVQGINPPVFTSYPELIENTESLIMKGTTYPDSEITVWLKPNGAEAKEVITNSDKDGKFIVLYRPKEKISIGDLEFWGQVTNSDGLSSPESPTYKISIYEKAIAVRSSDCSVYTNIFAIVELLILLLLVFGWFALLRKEQELCKIKKPKKNVLVKKTKPVKKITQKRTRGESQSKKGVTTKKKPVKKDEKFGFTDGKENKK